MALPVPVLTQSPKKEGQPSPIEQVFSLPPFEEPFSLPRRFSSWTRGFLFR